MKPRKYIPALSKPNSKDGTAIVVHEPRPKGDKPWRRPDFESLPMAFPTRIGQKYRHVDGYVNHVRGFVDGHVVMRFRPWSSTRWSYEVYSPQAFDGGMLRLDASRVRAAH